ncbi:MAG: hypothetical protein ACOH1P_05800 [Lysobacter sp.]
MTKAANPPLDRGLNVNVSRRRLDLACGVALLPRAAFACHGAASTGTYTS